MGERIFYPSGPFEGAQCDLLHLEYAGRSIKEVKYRVLWHCCCREDVVSHRFLALRLERYLKEGVPTPCPLCLKPRRSPEEPVRTPDSILKEQQTQGWLAILAGAAWPVPAILPQPSIWGSQ